ncbi:GDSL-type esterase/lipase family protein [Streptomonospora wellingtoniae]|uniref:GDSL-type esterase/lipase family protein n=1 Tax=Streptomonospora wellingtoniae TaxID=3075544 RepID=A0ABU2KSL8_9ACTN|nr:GDSL-type esterase/lipase family protein [Streptomonospora sp. DSM 45055]MDT0302279.1 GDSL-type esterase/lipase family protein [Streptomonospora sp. DSM 45055]
MDNRWCSAAAAAAALVLAGSLAACSAEGGQEAPRKSYYLSLGDSLAVGVQPQPDGTREETSQGYADALYRTLYDRDSTLEHERMGCGGEDSTTFVDGGLQNCAQRYEEGSQLAQAERFLKEHRDRTALVTVGIGANNFTGCVMEAAQGSQAEEPGESGAAGSGTGSGGADGGGSGSGLSGLGSIDRGCVDDGLERLREELPLIASRLRDAAGPDTRIVGMTYYNPFLAALLLEGGDAGARDGESGGEPRNGTVEYAIGVFEEMNTVITESYEDAGIGVADVAGAFHSSDFDVPAGSETGMPANVQRVCDYTWMCNTARGPDIHTNRAGAAAIARAFASRIEM